MLWCIIPQLTISLLILIFHQVNGCFENVALFKYLRTTATEQNLIQEEIGRRLNSGNFCHYSVQNVFSAAVEYTKHRFKFWGLHPIVFVTKTLLWWPSIASKFLFIFSVLLTSQHFINKMTIFKHILLVNLQNILSVILILILIKILYNITSDKYIIKNSMVWVRERTTSTKQPLVGEEIASCCG
jgi:hypothetical protein